MFLAVDRMAGELVSVVSRWADQLLPVMDRLAGELVSVAVRMAGIRPLLPQSASHIL